MVRRPGLDQDAAGGRRVTQSLPTTNPNAPRVDDDHTIVDDDHTIVIPPRRPDDYAVALPGGRRLWVSPPLSVEEVPGLLDIILREWSAARANLSGNHHRQRKPRRPSLASVAKQASKAAIPVARYEVRPAGTIVIVTGQSSTTEPNPWLKDLKVTKQ
jgi:hypothetical protein